MRWQGGRESENVEDRRGMPGPMVLGGGLGTLVLVVVVMLLGGDPRVILQLLNQAPPPAQMAPQNPGGAAPAEDELTQFVRVVLADTEDVWRKQFQLAGRQYQDPKLVLFSGQTQSACGFAQAAVGPFYCPADEKVYLDLDFFRELETRFAAPGEFPHAYVIAHEVGHHVQNLVGWSNQVHYAQQRADQVEANKLSVRLELQADYLAGVWAHHAEKARHFLERGDVQQALDAAAAIGDDNLQKAARGYVVPDSFTHGSSKQRVRWFRQGLETGDFPAAKQLFELDESRL